MKRKELDRNEDDEIDTIPSKLDWLPLDLKLAILTRVPAKSLMNVKLVSKMYSSIIRSQRFIDSFFSMSSTQPRFIVALNNGIVGPREERLIFLFSFSHEGGEEFSSSSSLVPKFEMVIPSMVFISQSGSCESLHGILAVRAGTQLVLCNPSTEQAIKLPIGSTLVGYDPIDDQHKVVARHVSRNYNLPVEYKVLTLGGGQGWRRIQVDSHYCIVSNGVCINGFVYYGSYTPKQPQNPGVVCFDVRSEKLSYIKAPSDVVFHGYLSIFIEYKGKLASIVRNPYDRFHSFDLWILEDVETHQWSRQNCVFPLSLWDSFGPEHHIHMCFPGTNKFGELIMAPMYLSKSFKPFYIFYYNVETRNFRRVRLLGIGEDEQFLRTYGFIDNIECHVRIAPHHIDSIASFKDPPSVFQDS